MNVAVKTCRSCGRELSDEPGLSLDCGGDCAACLLEAGDPDIRAMLEAKLEEDKRALLGWCGWAGEGIVADFDDLVEALNTPQFCFHCGADGHHTWEHWLKFGYGNWRCRCSACAANEGHVCFLDEDEQERRWVLYVQGAAVSYLPEE